MKACFHLHICNVLDKVLGNPGMSVSILSSVFPYSLPRQLTPLLVILKKNTQASFHKLPQFLLAECR